MSDRMFPNGNSEMPAVAMKTEKRVDHMVIDWPELRRFVTEAYAGKCPLKLANNRSELARVLGLSGSREPFWGFSLAQVKDWLSGGYESDALKNVDDFTPPMREKRRFVYDEDGDEIDLSAAWNGEDNFLTKWTKREVIPGVRLEFEVQFSAETSAVVVNAYQAWIAQAITAISQAGIDPEINVVFTAGNCFQGQRSNYNYHRQLVRVKREGETTDFQDWSAMLSPASYRVIGFATKVLHADKLGKNIASAIGIPDRSGNWSVRFDSEKGAIVVKCPPNAPRYFPDEEMSAQLRLAIEALKANVSN